MINIKAIRVNQAIAEPKEALVKTPGRAADETISKHSDNNPKGGFKSPKKWGGVLFSFVFVIIMGAFLPVSTCFADNNDKILFVDGALAYTQKNLDELIQLAEFLGRSNLSSKDKKAVKKWSIGDYQAAPKESASFYRNLTDVLLPAIKSKKGKALSLYRAELYSQFAYRFDKYPDYRKSADNFMAIIDRYNPPIREVLQLRQLKFNAVMQQAQRNQRSFNRTMQQAQHSSEMISKSLQDQSRRQAITLPGGKIISETGNKIYAEDAKGEKFELSK